MQPGKKKKVKVLLADQQSQLGGREKGVSVCACEPGEPLQARALARQ